MNDRLATSRFLHLVSDPIRSCRFFISRQGYQNKILNWLHFPQVISHIKPIYTTHFTTAFSSINRNSLRSLASKLVKYPPFQSPLISKLRINPISSNTPNLLPLDFEKLRNQLSDLLFAGDYKDACQLFEIHLQMHPTIRTCPYLVIMGIECYNKCSAIPNAEELVDFIEYQHCATLSVYEALLKVYSIHGLVDSALNLIQRVQQHGYPATSNMYRLLAQMYANLGYTEGIEKIICEMEIWIPSSRSTLYSILVRHHLDCKRLESAKEVMKRMYVMQMEFQPSIFVSLLRLRVEMGQNDAIEQTLREMQILEIKDNPDFYRAMCLILLDQGQIDKVMKVLDYMERNQLTTMASIYVMLLKKMIELEEWNHCIHIFDKICNQNQVKPNSSIFSMMGKVMAKQENDKLIKSVACQLLRLDIIPAPYAVTRIAQEFDRFNLKEFNLYFIRQIQSKMINGSYPIRPGFINIICYYLGKLTDHRETMNFVQWILKMRLPPTKIILSFVFKKIEWEMKKESMNKLEAGKPISDENFNQNRLNARDGIINIRDNVQSGQASIPPKTEIQDVTIDSQYDKDGNNEEIDLEVVCELVIQHAAILQLPHYYSAKLFNLLVQKGRKNLSKRLSQALSDPSILPNMERIGNICSIKPADELIDPFDMR